MRECGGTWDLPTQMEVGKWNDWEKNVFRSWSLCTVPLPRMVCTYLLEVHSNKSSSWLLEHTVMLWTAAAVQKSWQRKNSSIKYCNAELADYTKAAKFSGALSSFIYFLPVCYHSYAIQSFLWTILLNTTRQHIFFILTDSAWSVHCISLPLSNSRREQGEIRRTTFFYAESGESHRRQCPSQGRHKSRCYSS